MSLSKAAWKITKEHTNKLAYVFVRQPASRGTRENAIGIMVPRRLVQQALQLGWREENIRVVAVDQGRRGSIAAGGSGYEQMLNDIADGRVGAVFFLEASRVTRDTAAWHNFIKICQQAGTLVIDEQGLYDPRDVDDNMMLMLTALMAEVEHGRIDDRHRWAKRTLTVKGERQPSSQSDSSRTRKKR
jgi:DNA invertase Pin-like site-specific DNA recombinase